MISKYHKTFVWDKLKIVRKFNCVQLVLVLVNVSDEKNYDSWKYTSSKERSRCQRKWRLFLSSSCSLEGETSDEKHKEISKSSPSLFQKNPKDFELLLFAIFNFFNANFSRVIFLGWSNWLIMVVYCYCQIPSNATLNSQHIRRKRLVASCSLGGLFPEKLYHLDISNEKERLLLNGFFQKASCPSTAN